MELQNDTSQKKMMTLLLEKREWYNHHQGDVRSTEQIGRRSALRPQLAMRTPHVRARVGSHAASESRRRCSERRATIRRWPSVPLSQAQWRGGTVLRCFKMHSLDSSQVMQGRKVRR